LYGSLSGFFFSFEELNSIGTKASQALTKTIKGRDSRVSNLVAKYNKLASKLSAEGTPISQLPVEGFGKLVSDDKFWELERMHVREPWATNKSLRDAIAIHLQLLRAKEEIVLLEQAIRRYLHYNTTRLAQIRSAISNYSEGSLLHRELKVEAEKSTSAIVNLQKHFRTLWQLRNEKKNNSLLRKQQQDWIKAHWSLQESLKGEHR
jgi:hypothetical protein